MEKFDKLQPKLHWQVKRKKNQKIKVNADDIKCYVLCLNCGYKGEPGEKHACPECLSTTNVIHWMGTSEYVTGDPKTPQFKENFTLS